MRVGQTASNQVQDASGTKATAHAKKSGRATLADGAEKTTGAASGDAKAEISTQARDAGRAREAAMAAPDVREEKIAELKRRIAAGKYDVDPKAVADKMVDEHLEMSGLG